MKKLFLFFILICFLFVGCKTTKDAGETLPPESQTETSDQVQIEEVPPVEEDLESQPSLEEVIEEQGDLPLPFDQEFDSETDEVTSEEEFYYGDDFVPENQEENQIPENTDVELENEPELIISDEFLSEEEFISDDEFFSEEEFLENQLDELDNELEEIENPTEVENEISENQEDVLSTESETELVPENENQFSETSIDESFSSSQNNEDNKSEFVQSTNLKNDNEVATENKNSNITQNSEKEVEKNLDPNVEPITRKEIVEIVEDILSKKEPYIPTSNETEVLETEVTETILPSRTVNVAKNQTLLVPYPGSGWVYLGELESKALVGFRGKSFANDFTNFKFLPQKEGRTVLHFYKLDAISGNYIDDYLEVIVNPSVENYSPVPNVVTSPEFSYDMYLLQNNSSQTSPETPNDTVISSDTNSSLTNSEVEKFIDNTPIQTQNNTNENNQRKVQNDINNSTANQSVKNDKEESVKLNKDLAETEVVEEEPELLFLSDIFDDEETEIEDSLIYEDDIVFDTDLLEQAKSAYENKDYENALSLVNQFLELSNFSVDEALFLKGQILEKPFANRNIREALNCYKKIISSYPQSAFWDKADERIKYIQRFYFNIR